MGRIRTVKPEFFKHGDLFDAEKQSKLPLRIAFAGIWCQCDREGRFAWKPRELKLDILPYDECDFSRVLDALATRGFVVKYAAEGKFYGHVPSFKRHQVVNNRESESVLPVPNEINNIDASPTREPRDTHAPVGEGKGREGKTRNDALPEWLPRNDWEAYVEMRTKLKKPMTERAVELRIAEFDKLKSEGWDMLAMLHLMIASGWQNVVHEKLVKARTEYRAVQSEAEAWPEFFGVQA